MEKRWTIKQKGDSELIGALARRLCPIENATRDEFRTYEIVASLLVQRGICSYEEAEKFFRPKYEHLHDSFLMNDMEKAVERIMLAIKAEEKILVYGDYDVDGTSAVALVYSYLEKFYTEIDFYIPDRYKEGYGVSFQGVDWADENDFKLIICLDCGIKAHKEIAYAKQKGIDFIVCDHHLPSDTLPEAWAVLDPKRCDSNYPYKELSGCGIGFKLVSALQRERNLPFDDLLEYLDLVAISIAADVVPLTGENRVLAYYGLKKINRCPRIGLEAILASSNVKHENNNGKLYFNRELTLSDLVFLIGPRINAAGRMESGRLSVQLLKAKNATEAKEAAEKIEKHNRARKEKDKKTTKEAFETLERDASLKEKKAIVVVNDNWHKGVIGIVASRLVERYYKPTIVFSFNDDDNLITGSARSVKDFDIYSVIESCSHLLTHFGGHKFAAGLSLKPENLQEFTELFEQKVSENITETQTIPEIDIDLEINLRDITQRLFRILRQFAPFGPENNVPIFSSTQLIGTDEIRIVGSNHLKLSVVSREVPSYPYKCIGFGMGEHFDKIRNGYTFDICYQIDENTFNGQTYLQLNLKDLHF
ncbi:MAG: single-stranded-DNA-specific exonuclease RecJ [Bacteroidales bacterium]|nr:single-stranded-DNA-specific exonuclease RecJ [Bacteroidales bacterium]